MTVSELIEMGQTTLKEAGIENARQETIWILEALLGDLNSLPSGQNVYSTVYEQCARYLQRREQGEPLAYILGHWEFFGRQIEVGPGVLVPRPETEEMVAWCRDWLQKNHWSEFTIWDLGCGSGCIGLTLLKEFPDAQLVGVDVSERALSYARKNSENWELSERCEWVRERVQQLSLNEHGFTPRVFLANPPYIDPGSDWVEESVREFEPPQALFSDQQGLSDVMEWVSHTAPLMQPGELYVCELGADQGAVAREYFESLSLFENVQVHQDLAQRDRWITAIKKGEPQDG